jgi:hypothetical protein
MGEAAGISTEDPGLFTDLYQLTMAQSYFEHQQNRMATFSLFICKNPPHHTYFVAAGLVASVNLQRGMMLSRPHVHAYRVEIAQVFFNSPKVKTLPGGCALDAVWHQTCANASIGTKPEEVRRERLVQGGRSGRGATTGY